MCVLTQVAYAETLYEFTDTSDDISNSLNQFHWYPIDPDDEPTGFGWTGELGTIIVAAGSGISGHATATVRCFTNADLNSTCPEWNGAIDSTPIDSTIEGAFNLWVFNGFQDATSTTLTLNANRFYTIQVIASAPFIFPKGNEDGDSYCLSDTCTGIPYLVLLNTVVGGDGGFASTTQTRFTNNYAPQMLATAEGTVVNFQQEYYYSGIEGYNRVGIKLKNENTGQIVVVPESQILGTGLAEFEQEMNLQENTQYTWQPYMYKQTSAVGTSTILGGSLLDGSFLNAPGLLQGTTTPVLFGAWKVFSTGEFNWSESAIFGDSAFLTGGILDGESVLTQEGNASTTLIAQVRTGFAIIDALGTKFPFNWMIAAGQVIGQLHTHTATIEKPEMVVDFGYLGTLQTISTTTSQNWTVAYIDEETFDQVAGFAPIILARQMAVYILWIVLLFFVMREAYGVFGTRAGREYQDHVESNSNNTVANVRSRYR